MRELLLVFLGGGCGSMLRYLVSVWWKHINNGICVFPWQTLLVNILGCVLIGVVYSSGERWGWSAEARLLLATGFCGGLTTFSTFSYETVTMMQSGYVWGAVVYAVLSVMIGLATVAWISS